MPTTEFSLDSDAFDVAFLATPPPAAMTRLLKVLSTLAQALSSPLPSSYVVPYGSFVTGTMVTDHSDLDVTVLGPGYAHQTAGLVLSVLEQSGFEITAKPTTNPCAPPLLRFRQKATRVEGDITFNQVSGVRTSNMLANLGHQFPVATMLTVVIKSIVVGAALPSPSIAGIVVSILAFATVRSLRMGTMPLSDNRPRDPTLGEALMAFTQFFGSTEMQRTPDRYTISVPGGVSVNEADEATSARFLAWVVVDPTTGQNVAARCPLITDFARLMERVGTELRQAYTSDLRRASVEPHLMQRIRELGHVIGCSTEPEASEAVDTASTTAVGLRLQDSNKPLDKDGATKSLLAYGQEN